jgi:hypothetical protein
MRRISTVFVFLISLTPLPGFRSSTHIDAAPKGWRAMIAHGQLMKGAVVVEWDDATALYVSFTRDAFNGEKYKARETIEDRPCITLSFFRLNITTESIEGRYLRPDQATFTYYFWPATGDEPAVSLFGNVMTAEQTDALAAWGVPVRVEKGAKGPCEYRWQMRIENSE